jgi:hypothetical protein
LEAKTVVEKRGFLKKFKSLFRSTSNEIKVDDENEYNRFISFNILNEVTDLEQLTMES